MSVAASTHHRHHTPKDDMTTRDKRVSRPLLGRLKEKEVRPLDRMKEPIVKDERFSVRLGRSEEVAAATVGLLMLDMVERTGRTRLFERAIDGALEQLTADLDPEEIMRLEVEAYEVLDWLVGDAQPVGSDTNVAIRNEDGILYDPDAPLEALIREALFQEFDVRIHYYTRKRGETTERVISPYAIAADKYVRAWCHARRAQRVFRMDRISYCVPVNGREFPKPVKPEPAAADQLSLLDDDS